MQFAMLDKKSFRKRYREIRDQMPESIRQKENKAISHYFCGMSLYQKSQKIFTYYSVGSEVDTRRIIAQAFADEKRIFLPVCGEKNSLRLYEIRHPEDLMPGAYGIPIPTNCSEPFQPFEVDLSIVPGLCFDAEGYRVGYGGGYYDRFLPQIKENTAVGLCYFSSLVPKVPRNIYDRKCDWIVTGNGVIKL